MRRILTSLLLFIIICTTVVSQQKQDASKFDKQSSKPNVVLIMLDDLNDYTGFLGGHPQAITPNMDELASHGVVFTNAHTNAPICAPSRASMLTGIYPHVSKNYWFSKWHENEVLSNSKTLMQFMSDNGYLSLGTGKLMHDRVKSEWDEYGVNNDFGPYPFDGKKATRHPSVPKEYYHNKNDGLYGSLADVPNVKPTNKRQGFNGWFDTRNGKPFKYVNDDNRDLMSDEKSANWAVNKLEELENSDNSKPFFLAVGFVRPHTPLVAPQKYFDKYPLETLQLPKIKENDNEDTYYRTTFPWEAPWTKHAQNLKNAYDDYEEGLRTYVQAYLACVTFVDDQVGKVMTALNNSKFNENTIVILVSDHGYNHGEKDFLYKNNLWEETTRVPMVIRTPETLNSNTRKVNHPVSLIDVYPTIADLCNIESSNLKNSKGAVLSGYSLKPFINENEENWKGSNVALTVARGNHKSDNPDEQSYSVRSENFRYIRYVNGKEELYDHTNDEYEWTNLAYNKKYKKIKKKLEAQMNELLKK